MYKTVDLESTGNPILANVSRDFVRLLGEERADELKKMLLDRVSRLNEEGDMEHYTYSSSGDSVSYTSHASAMNALQATVMVISDDIAEAMCSEPEGVLDTISDISRSLHIGRAAVAACFVQSETDLQQNQFEAAQLAVAFDMFDRHRSGLPTLRDRAAA